jgi:TonB-like protein
MKVHSIVLALSLPITSSRLAAQARPASASSPCDSVLRAARTDSTEVTARAYLLRHDGHTLTPRARSLLLEAFSSEFRPPKPLQLSVFASGPVRTRMLQREVLVGDSLSKREPLIYGVYDFTLRRDGSVTGIVATIPTMVPGFDEQVTNALVAAAADSVLAMVPRALDVDSLRLELRITTGPEDTRLRVAPDTLFNAKFPLVRMADARPIGITPLPEYPPDERDEGRDGEVLLRVVIDTGGEPVIPTLEILHATSPSFALSAARALARYHFAPAHVGSCPVSQVTVMPFWLSLRP